ncbi:hypothetical protein RHMOL_Rhmol13G0006300 [Rhododendron molle]|uniref:Uncharacterized protein n=1 Tax=Rhododendron molle TaxID=49168 RepID=A0ACC0L235_RHOML|nr:hypothetical protein RHMOL_Rhmol13G0006300 [Rhododendron molle]
MGDDAPQSLFGYQENRRRWNSNGPLLPSENKVSTRRWKEIISKRPRMILMKRRYRLQGSTRPAANVFEKRVRVLRKLVPNKESDQGLDGLFRDTTDYILALEMRVKVMQIMVKALSAGGSDDE